MTHLISTLVLATAGAAALAPCAHAAGKVEVEFVHPEQFADIGRGAYERERTLSQLRGMFDDLGKVLPDGDTLQLQVLDVNLAGELEPWGRRDDLRVMRGRADWPKMHLRYTLLENGRTVKSGDARLSDMNYLMNAGATAGIHGPLQFEQRMVKRWMEDTFALR